MQKKRYGKAEIRLQTCDKVAYAIARIQSTAPLSHSFVEQMEYFWIIRIGLW